MKIKDTIMKLFFNLVYFGTCGYIGVRCAQIGLDGSDKYFVLIFIVAILYMYVSFMVHIILHEAGHLVAGLLTGYEFVSFRIGSIVWIKEENGKLTRKKMKIQGTGGQCLMCPPNVEVEKCPYKWYHLSGGIANLILGTIGIVLAIVLPHNFIVFLLCEEFGVIGLALGLTNLIPCKNGGIQNDGYNLIDLGKNMDAKRCMNLVLKTNALLTVADSYSELPHDLVQELKMIDFKKMDITNSSIANAFNYQCAMYFVEKDYSKVYELQKYMIETNGVLELFKNEARCECLFYELISGQEKKIIEKRYDKSLQKYIKATSIYPSRLRLMYAYYTLYEKDNAKAEDVYSKLQKSVDTHVIKADAKMELEVVNAIKENRISIM